MFVRVAALLPWLGRLSVLAVVLTAALPVATPPSEAVAEDAGSAGGAATEAEPAKKPKVNALEYYGKALGWLYGIVFLLLSFVFVALLILNILALRRQAIMPDALAQNFEAALNEKNYQGAYELAKTDESMLGAVLAAGMSKLQSGYDEAEKAMNEAGADEAMKLEHRLSYLALIGSLAPMLGLLGTVDGMIVSFQEIERSIAPPEPAALAGGISTALVTTIVGLWLAIPAIAGFGILKNLLSRNLYDIGALTENLMSRFQTKK